VALRTKLLEIFARLETAYGPQHWWPGETPFEVIVGAILTQSAAWTNVEKCITNLKAKDVLSPRALREAPLEDLAQLVFPSGYYNVKAGKVKAFVSWLGERHNDSLEALFAREVPELREELLRVHGIGEETADSILLYAANKPIFVIDAYTRRIMDRVFAKSVGRTYADYQDVFMKHLPQDEKLFNEYHALFVRHGKERCKKKPQCGDCCLHELCASSAG
jgi:endonuclease-3 related protein